MQAFTRLLLALTVAALLVGAALAQQAKPGGTTAQPGAAGQAGQAAQQPATLPPTISQPLFRMPEVRRELNMNDQQFNRLNGSFNQLSDRFRNDFNRLGQLDERARAARQAELERNFSNEFGRTAGGILNEQQMNRLRQLELQRSGLNAFNNPDVQRQLNLTDQQLQQLRALNDQTTRQQQQILQGAGTNRNQTLQRLNDLNRQTQEQTNAILNEQQRRTFQQMTGQPFNFPPNLPSAPNPPRP